MYLPAPYVLFIAHAPHAKMAFGVLDWHPESCVVQMRYPASALDIGLPDMSFDEALVAGTRSVLIGSVPARGIPPDRGLADLEIALRAGLDIVTGCTRG